MGVGGAGVTILDGSRPLPDREGSIIYTLTGAPADLVLDGLTLQNGTGAPYSKSLDVIGGGAIFAEALNNVRIERCSFSGNVSHVRGGDLYLLAETAAITQCDLEINGGGSNGGASIYNEWSTTLTIQDCTFQSATGDGSRSGIVAQSG